MDGNIKYVHTNIVARNWRALAQFYIDVFDCKPVYPERDLAGEWIDKITNINNVKIRGIHLSLPGCENGPTLEIFEYEPGSVRRSDFPINRQGYRHIAFHTDSVENLLEKAVDHGGEKLGEVIEKNYEGAGILTVVYVKDPEGNFIEIQNWRK